LVIVLGFLDFCMAKPNSVSWKWNARPTATASRSAAVVLAFVLTCALLLPCAQTAAAEGPPQVAAAAPPPAARTWAQVPRITGRLNASDIGVVINRADPYSVAVGAHYVASRKLAPEQVLEVDLPPGPVLDRQAFEALRTQIDRHFGSRAQALALAWQQPYAVQCFSITGALALGLAPALCEQSCRPSTVSPYFNSAARRPLQQHGMRLSMLLAAGSVGEARRMIDRGVASEGQLGLRGAPPVTALFVSTADTARNVRARLFPPAGLMQQAGVDVRVIHEGVVGEQIAGRQRLLMVQTGAATVPHLDTLGWADGALADHLTSFGGRLDGSGGQTSAVQWIDSGATASYGSVSEPCNHPQKFPHPQVLLLHYLQGSTAIEAYWRSVAWPHQGVFVGEPLAAPFARR
jgi:uncharacterized protein (TIGR03790 family)